MWKLARRILTALSLVLLLATIGMWLWAQWETLCLTDRRVVGGSDAQRERDVEVRFYPESLWLRWITTRYPAMDRAQADAVRASRSSELGFFYSAVPASPPPSRVEANGVDHFGFAWSTTDSLPSKPEWIWVDGPPWTSYRPRYYSTATALPWWFLTLIFAVAPGRTAWKWLCARRRKPGHCRACGYDMRASPDPAGPLLRTCPECGRDSG